MFSWQPLSLGLSVLINKIHNRCDGTPVFDRCFRDFRSRSQLPSAKYVVDHKSMIGIITNPLRVLSHVESCHIEYREPQLNTRRSLTNRVLLLVDKACYRSMGTTGDPVGEPLHWLEPVPVRGSFLPVSRFRKWQGCRSNRTKSVGLYHPTQRTHIQINMSSKGIL